MSDRLIIERAAPSSVQIIEGPVLARIQIREGLVSEPGPAGPAGTPGGIGGDYPAAETISGHRLVRWTAAGLVHASPDSLTGATIEGLSLNAAAAGDSVSVVRLGPVEESSWSWMPDGPLFLAAAGALTQTPPAQLGLAVHLPVGVAITPVLIALHVGEPVVLFP